MIKSRYRTIKTSIPNIKSLKLINDLKKFEARGMHGQVPILWNRADNFQVHDYSGNKWIDFSSTILVANVGHSNKKIISEIKKLLNKPLIHTYSYVSKERYEYLKKLIKFTPEYLQKAFLLSSGSEATEAALKIMRYYGKYKKKQKNIILSFEGNWHGRSLGAEMMGGKMNLKNWITFHDKNIIHMPFPYPWDKDVKLDSAKFFKKNINKIIKKKKINPRQDISGIILETFQGWGTIFYPQNFINELKKFCKKNNILISFDEIQSGFGRTGKLFGYMHYNIKPDLVCCGKGAGSGFPLSFVLGKKKIMDLPPEGEMSSTHSGNPLACVIGKATIEEIKKRKLIYKSMKYGKLLHNKLLEIKKNYPNLVKNVYGKGLVASIIFNESKKKNITNKICDECFSKGLIVIKTGREALKIAPPLTISKEALEEGIKVIKESIEKFYK